MKMKKEEQMKLAKPLADAFFSMGKLYLLPASPQQEVELLNVSSALNEMKKIVTNCEVEDI